MIDIKNFDSSLLKIDKKWHKNIDIYNMVFITIKGINDYESIEIRVDSYVGGKNGNKYLIFAATDKNKEVLKNYTELSDRIENLTECNSIEKMND